MNQRRILLVLLAAAVVVAASWLLLTPSEPTYQGKPLTHWLDGRPEEITAAVNQIGPNAIPTLLRLLNTHDSKIKLKLLQLAQKQHLIKVALQPTDFRRFEAKFAFTILGPRAQPALPALLKIYREHRPGFYDDPRGIAEIFASMGPAAAAAVPTLAQSTTDPDLIIRCSAIQTLGSIHSRPDITVPALTASLRDPSEYVRTLAAIILADFGSDACSAIPELTKTLSDPYVSVRNAVAVSLGKFGTNAQSAVPELTKALADPSPNVKHEAAIALQKINPASAPAAVK